MKIKVAFISCTKSKAGGIRMAKDLYSPSSLFTKAYDYCLKNYDMIYILSAKYHLLKPTDIVESYEQTLNNMSKSECQKWAREVLKLINNEIQFGTLKGHTIEGFYFHAGEKYRKYLIKDLSLIAPCSVPLEGMGIGVQMGYYNKQGWKEKNLLF